MFLDSALTFNSAVGTAQAFTTTADFAGVIDVTGAGSGNAPAMVNSFPASSYQTLGNDYGAGDGIAIPHVVIFVTTAGTGTDTVTFSLSAAPDNGSSDVAGTYQILASTQAFVGTALTLGTVIDIPVPPVPSNFGEHPPRFYKLTYTTSGTTGVSALADMILNPAQVAQLGRYSNNYIVV